MNQDANTPEPQAVEIYDTDKLTNALVRNVPQIYIDHYTRAGLNISEEHIIEQHKAYVSALESAGLNISFIKAHEDLYDCVFIEDTAVVLKNHALMAKMISRRQSETEAVEDFLRQNHTVSQLGADAQLEGGDVLHIGDTTYVGLSGRTNSHGAEWLKAFLLQFGRKVVKIPVDNCLHLKSGVTYIGNGTIIAISGWFNLRRFDVEDVLYTQSGEHPAANCLRIRDNLIMPEGFPQTEVILRRFTEKHNLKLIKLDTTEFRKGGGLLSCLSIIW